MACISIVFPVVLIFSFALIVTILWDFIVLIDKNLQWRWMRKQPLGTDCYYRPFPHGIIRSLRQTKSESDNQ